MILSRDVYKSETPLLGGVGPGGLLLEDVLVLQRYKL